MPPTCQAPSPKSRHGRLCSALGVNDDLPAVEAVNRLLKLRDGIRSQQVSRMLPARPDETRGMIQVIARPHGDTVIEIRGSTGRDGFHLTGSANHRVAGVFEIAAER